MKIKTYLIDDEPKALAILEDKIKRFCKEIEIVGQAQKPSEAIKELETLQPDLVFLDVAMPKMSGFDLLKHISHPSFEVIFATGFDKYAIEAIKHCAIGYLVKPIDNDELVAAVNKAKENIEEKNALEKNQQFINNLSAKRFQDKKVVIPTQEGLEFLEISQISNFEGVDGYTKIHLKNRKAILSSLNIGHFVKMFKEHDFFQVHKSHLINLNYIEKYLKEGYIIIGEQKIPVSRNRRNEFLEMINKL